MNGVAAAAGGAAALALIKTSFTSKYFYEEFIGSTTGTWEQNIVITKLTNHLKCCVSGEIFKATIDLRQSLHAH